MFSFYIDLAEYCLNLQIHLQLLKFQSFYVIACICSVA